MAVVERGRRRISLDDSEPDETSAAVPLFGFIQTRIGLRIDDEQPPTEDQWQKLGEYLAWMEGSIQWLVGDWMNYGEANFGERASQIIDATGWNLDTIKQYAWVAKEVPISRRDPKLSFFCHRVVAALPASDQKRWLKKAKDDGLDVETLKLEVQAEQSPDRNAPCWLIVSCASMKDRIALKAEMEKAGRSCKIGSSEKREPAAKPRKKTR